MKKALALRGQSFKRQQQLFGFFNSFLSFPHLAKTFSFLNMGPHWLSTSTLHMLGHIGNTQINLYLHIHDPTPQNIWGISYFTNCFWQDRFAPHYLSLSTIPATTLSSQSNKMLSCQVWFKL